MYFVQLLKQRGFNQCYMGFMSSISGIYIGWLKFQDKVLGQSNYNISLEEYCMDQGELNRYVQQLNDFLMGQGECDALQTLYDGLPESNIYSGWRDTMADKSAYLVMYLAQGITL